MLLRSKRLRIRAGVHACFGTRSGCRHAPEKEIHGGGMPLISCFTGPGAGADRPGRARTPSYCHIIALARCRFPQRKSTDAIGDLNRGPKVLAAPRVLKSDLIRFFSSKIVFFSYKFLQHSSKPSKFLRANGPSVTSSVSVLIKKQHVRLVVNDRGL